VWGVATRFLLGATPLLALGVLFEDSWMELPLNPSTQGSHVPFLYVAQFRSATHGHLLWDISTKLSYLNHPQHFVVSICHFL
jgi:hypothetical protein